MSPRHAARGRVSAGLHAAQEPRGTARHAARAQRGVPVGGAALAAVAGLGLVVGGVSLLAGEPAVRAEDFGAPTAEPTTSSPVTASEGTGPDGHVQSALTAVAHAPTPVPPAQVTLPGVTAEVVAVGVLPSGELQLPADPARVGWWAAGAVPGQAEGTVVLAGHMDGLRRGGAMSALLVVASGDVVSLEDSRGRAHEYRVVERSTTPQESLDPSLFTPDGPHRLVLVTCGGTYDEATGRYSENIVVVAEPVG
ncbi:class F sortase [Georgenia satyanarayanai]|uniref:class F sortase n=1 Tax=Georgenia satyanarayanai TaxID=860221 RepID=UPI00203FE00A|nr:class F sortase [Georgenia satyanarayanai]MCM3662170.1 class F sortase [Georgenia satyanarayanai]